MGFDSLFQRRTFTGRRRFDGRDRVSGAGMLRLLDRIPSYSRPYPQPACDWTKSQRHEYALGHWPLVLFLAHRFRGPLELEDAVQAGFISLFGAAERYDHEKGATFGTYAFTCVRNGIVRARGSEHRTIRYPEYVERRIRRLTRAMAFQESRRGRTLSVNEFAELLSDHDPERTMSLMRRSFVYPDNLITYDPVTRVSESYWHKVKPEYTDTRSLEEQHQLLRMGVDLLRFAWQTAFEEERMTKIFVYRFGLDRGGRHRTLEEVGTLVGVTYTRVAQLERILIRKMQHQSRRKIFGDVYGRQFWGTMLDLLEVHETVRELNLRLSLPLNFDDETEGWVRCWQERLAVKQAPGKDLGPRPPYSIEHVEVAKLARALQRFSKRDRQLWLDFSGWNERRRQYSTYGLADWFDMQESAVRIIIKRVMTAMNKHCGVTIKRNELMKTWNALFRLHPEVQRELLALHPKLSRVRDYDRAYYY